MAKTINRRSFLRLAGGSGAAIALSPLSAIALTDDWYRNNRLGFGLRKPTSWSFVSVTDFARLMDDQEQHVADPELMAELRSLGEDPILVINKYTAAGEHFCPSIQVFAEPPELLGPGDWENFCREATKGFQAYNLPDFHVETPSRQFILDGYAALELKITYSFQAHGRSYPTRLHSVFARTELALLNFQFFGSAHGPEECGLVLRRCLNTISFNVGARPA